MYLLHPKRSVREFYLYSQCCPPAHCACTYTIQLNELRRRRKYENKTPSCLIHHRQSVYDQRLSLSLLWKRNANTHNIPHLLFNKIHISTEKQSQRCCLSRYRNVENTQPKYNTLFDFGWKSESLKRSHSHIVNSNNTNFNTAPYVQCNAFRSEKIEIG